MQMHKLGKDDMKIDLGKACKAICRYCEMGMPLYGNVHIRPFGQFVEEGTDTDYPCKAARLRELDEPETIQDRAEQNLVL